jgi:ribosomal-protein-alanine N-acetyltransferase
MKVKLRPFKESDAERLALLANNIKIAKFLRNGFPHPYTVEHAKNFIGSLKNDDPTQRFVITLNDEMIGGTGLNLQDDIFELNAEIGYWIGEPYWGNGYMSDAIQQITEYGFKNFKINRIFARVFGNNPASMRVVEKAGYKLEAKYDQTLLKYGEILDEYIYAKRR